MVASAASRAAPLASKIACFCPASCLGPPGSGKRSRVRRFREHDQEQKRQAKPCARNAVKHRTTITRRPEARQVSDLEVGNRARPTLNPVRMLRPPFPAHRRYSITHRAVQRLRELIRTNEEDDDETLRDRLDLALAHADDAGRAIKTLDAMLGEPQTLIPVDAFGEVLYAIVKEDTVVTVLPQGHGEEILQRGQAMAERVANGGVVPRAQDRDDDDRWSEPPARRRWRRDQPQSVVIERIVRGAAPGGGVVSRIESVGSMETNRGPRHEAPAAAVAEAEARQAAADAGKVFELRESKPQVEDKPGGPRSKVAEVLASALQRGQRRAAVAALAETLSIAHRDTALKSLWQELVSEGVLDIMTVGDLIEAVRGA